MELALDGESEEEGSDTRQAPMSKREKEESDIDVRRSRRAEGTFGALVRVVYRWFEVL